MNETEQLFEFYWSHWGDIVEGLKARKGLSAPLLIKPHEEYFQASKKLMIVGQETNRWYVEGEPRTATLETLHSVLVNYESHVRERLSSSKPFWVAAREVAEVLNPELKGHPSLVWSNLVKTDVRKTVGNVVSGKRPVQDEEWISSFKMLQAEIKILEPHVVVFFVGPKYCDRLLKTFPGAIFGLPTLEQPWGSVKHPDLPTHSYLTYHPGYLWRKKLRGVIGYIAKAVLKST